MTKDVISSAINPPHLLIATSVAAAVGINTRRGPNGVIKCLSQEELTHDGTFFVRPWDPLNDANDALEALEGTGLEYEVWRARGEENERMPYHCQLFTREGGICDFKADECGKTFGESVCRAILRYKNVDWPE